MHRVLQQRSHVLFLAPRSNDSLPSLASILRGHMLSLANQVFYTAMLIATFRQTQVLQENVLSNPEEGSCIQVFICEYMSVSNSSNQESERGHLQGERTSDLNTEMGKSGKSNEGARGR